MDETDLAIIAKDLLCHGLGMNVIVTEGARKLYQAAHDHLIQMFEDYAPMGYKVFKFGTITITIPQRHPVKENYV